MDKKAKQKERNITDEHQDVKLSRIVKAVILTISGTRNFDIDKDGQCVFQLLQVDNVKVSGAYYTIVEDEKVAITTQVKKWLEEDVDVIITTGGMGIAQHDVTIEAVKPLLTKEIEGFGELFRYLSYVEDVDTCALLSHTVAGTVDDKLIFSIPGSTGVVKLVLGKLIEPELNHLIHEPTK